MFKLIGLEAFVLVHSLPTGMFFRSVARCHDPYIHTLLFCRSPFLMYPPATGEMYAPLAGTGADELMPLYSSKHEYNWLNSAPHSNSTIWIPFFIPGDTASSQPQYPTLDSGSNLVIVPTGGGNEVVNYEAINSPLSLESEGSVVAVSCYLIKHWHACI